MKQVTFECEKFPSLGFYVNNSYRRFVGGKFTTEDEMVIAKCRTLNYVKELKKEEPEKVEKTTKKSVKENSESKKKSSKKPKEAKKDK